ncbi:MAG: hypothetical protein PHH00_02630 [Candidatus Nanoarchaeia archaeon]|nr:hypothetical protein [Candidatus Nanoarchaeia archaeon]
MEKSKPDKTLDNRQIFLLLFARELIRNSEEGLLQLKRLLERAGERQVLEMKIQEPVQKTNLENKDGDGFPLIKSILSESPRITVDGEFSAMKPVSIRPQRREISNGHGTMAFPILRIPEPKLPPEFQHLKPVPSRKEIDLDKLNPFINDTSVKRIECDGPNKPVLVSGSMGRRPTELVLSSNEIDEIVERFSRAARIPVDVGVFRVVVGNLIFSAIISDVVPSRFVITKMAASMQMNFKPIPPMMPPPVNMPYSNYINPVNVPLKSLYN